MMNNLISTPRCLPDMIITMGIGLENSEKYEYEIILNDFSQEIKKGSLWKNTGDIYTIKFTSIPVDLKEQLEHSGYQILEIKFIFWHRDLEKIREIKKEIILTNPSISSRLDINTHSISIYNWTIYNTWTHAYEQRD